MSEDEFAKIDEKVNPMNDNEPTPDAEERSSLNIMGAVSIFIAVTSIIIAGASAFFSYGPRVDAVRASVVEDLFESFEEWNALALDDPYLLHLISPPDRYDQVSALIEQGAVQLNEARIIELVLAEMAMADVLVAAYEEMLVDLSRAEASDDDFVLQETRAALEYFEQRVMLNPRMLHLWSEFGGDRGEAARTRHASHVLTRAGESPATDPDGPIIRARNSAARLD